MGIRVKTDQNPIVLVKRVTMGIHVSAKTSNEITKIRKYHHSTIYYESLGAASASTTHHYTGLVPVLLVYQSKTLLVILGYLVITLLLL